MSTITIYDIAKEACVSPATVSRVLTGSAKVRPAKEREIRKVMAKHNYSPNAMAQSLIAGRSKLIGMIVADIRNPYYAELCVACEVAAKNLDYRVVLCNVFDDVGLQEDSLKIFSAQRVDAIIQLGCLTDRVNDAVDYINKIDSLSVPFISAGKFDIENAYTYSVDHSEGLRLAFEYLHEMGHERIALLGGRLDVRPTFEKWTKYIYLLGLYGIPLRSDYVQEGSYDYAGGFDCMNRLLDLSDPPTAVISVNDYASVGALSAINARGLRCPDDISIVSHDNTLLTKITTPVLASVDACYEQLGSGLVSTAIGLINGEKFPKETYLTPHLIPGASCAPPKDTTICIN